ncbi:unnamed protein product [Lampetra fluviatilis]
MAAATSIPASTSSSTPQSTSFPIVLVAVDLACIILAALPTVVLAIVDRPYQRGFSCVDESIQYPYLGVETVPFSAVVAGGFLLNIVPMAVGEWLWCRAKGSSSRSFVRNLAVSSLYKKLGAFLLGAAMSQAFTDVAKYSIGRLRPHFLHVCALAPGFNCSAAMSGAVPCTGEAHLVNEARKSFYSGHSSFAMYSMLYLALYLESRLTWRGARTLRPLLQAASLLLACWVALSRVSDYMHHWSDVLAGLLQGAAVACFVAFCLSDLFKKRRPCGGPQHLPADSLRP